MNKNLIILLGGYLLMHLTLLFFDMGHPDAFLVGDRAGWRFSNINHLLSAIHSGEDLLKLVAKLGLVGDYLYHAVIFSLFGRIGVIVVQIGLGAVSVYYLYRMTYLLSQSYRISCIASIFYMLLPHTLAFPHLLVSENLSNPLIVVSFYYLIQFLIEGKISSPAPLFGSAILLGLSITIRPITILFPVVVYFVIVISKIKPIIFCTKYYLIPSYFFILFFMLFMFTITGQFNLGKEGGTLGLNLFLKTERALQDNAGPLMVASGINKNERRISPKQYALLVAKQPGPFINLVKFDIGNIMLNSGVNKFFGYYLGVYDVNKSRRGKWREVVDRQGITKAIQLVLQQSALFVILTISYTSFWLLLLIGALIGLILLWREKLIPKNVLFSLGLYPLYVILFTLLVVSGPRSGHRSSFEFIVCLLGAIFFGKLYSYLKYIRRNGSP